MQVNRFINYLWSRSSFSDDDLKSFLNTYEEAKKLIIDGFLTDNRGESEEKIAQGHALVSDVIRTLLQNITVMPLQKLLYEAIYGESDVFIITPDREKQTFLWQVYNILGSLENNTDRLITEAPISRIIQKSNTTMNVYFTEGASFSINHNIVKSGRSTIKSSLVRLSLLSDPSAEESKINISV